MYLVRVNFLMMIFAFRLICLFVVLAVTSVVCASEPRWSARFDGRVRFYQTTELGALVVGTENSLYGVDGESGEILWRRRNTSLGETDVAPVPGTDLVLLSFARGGRTRLEAADALTGNIVWQSERVRGSVMQMAVDLENHLLALVLARDANGRARENFKRRPLLHVFNLATGDELWRREGESEIEMLPARWSGDDDTAYTLNNYRPPMFLDGRLFLFYEGVTSFDARTGEAGERERFRVNENGLALTEADAVYDDRFIYTSGRGRIRAVSRQTNEIAWEARDLGLTPEMILADGKLYVRTGGQFTRLEDGEIIERGPYGVSAIDANTGRTLWRYRGADKGITNLVLIDRTTGAIADRDDLILIDLANGRRRARIPHEVERAAFVLINEAGHAVVGGRSEIAAFDVRTERNVWRARHAPPGRGILRTVGAIAARSAALYFRYGGAASSAFRGVQLARTAVALRWSGLASRVLLPNLTTLAANSAREYVAERFSPFGIAARTGTIRRSVRVPRPSIDVEERLLDRLDPARQLERLSRFLWRRRRLATLRGEWMYFYTNIRGDESGRGLAGVNVNNGRLERAIPISDPDERFITDEATNLLYSADGNRLHAYALENPSR
jgi:outer membrane protein assembly factor BamB